jgi:[ribosomal protein S18]-alanine N-acetyltransferase
MGSSEQKPLAEGTSPRCRATNSGIELRRIIPSDVEEVMRIERTSFSSPWSARFFLEELRAPCARCLLASSDDKIIGYVLYWALPGEADIHNLAVDNDYRRRGIGSCLLRAVIDEATQQGLARVTLEVRRSNEAAQGLYHSLGFVVQGVRAGYYSDNGEDAFVMALELAPVV